MGWEDYIDGINKVAEPVIKLIEEKWWLLIVIPLMLGLWYMLKSSGII